MAHFSAFGDSTSSLIWVTMKFKLCNNHYLAALVLLGSVICFCERMLCMGRVSRLFVF